MCCVQLIPCFVTEKSLHLSVYKSEVTIVPTYGAIVSSQWNGPEHCKRSGADPQDMLFVCLGLLACLIPPFLPTGHTGRLLRALLGFSLLFLIAHSTFQICLHTVPSLDQLLGSNCESLRGGEAAAQGQQFWGRASVLPELTGGWRGEREPPKPCKNLVSPWGGWLPCLTQALPNVGHPLRACL